MDFMPLKGKTMKLASLALKFAPSVTLSAFLLFLVAVQTPFEASGRPFEKSDLPVEKAQHAVWEINNYELKPEEALKEDPYGRGVAFAISSTTFITNFHVLKDFISAGSSIGSLGLRQEGNTLKLKIRRVLALSATYDFVLFETEGSVENYVDLAKTFSPENDRGFILGYEAFTLRRVDQVRKIYYEDTLHYGASTDQKILGGMSGGPFLNQDGEVVGVLRSSEKDLSYAYIIKLEPIKKFIEGRLGITCFEFDYQDLESCFSKGMLKINELAHNGDSLAQYRLGSKGSNIVVEDSALALRWLEQSANNGFPLSQLEIGDRYFYDIKDFKLAFPWYQKAAHQNSVVAQRMLAYMYAKGVGVDKNTDLAIKWAQRAVNQGDTFSQKVLTALE